MKFDVSKNRFRAAGGKALAGALKGNSVMQELNISSNDLGYNSNYNSDMSGIIAISDAIPTMGALVTVTFGDKQAVTMTATMAEADFRGKLNSYEAQIVAAFLPKCQ